MQPMRNSSQTHMPNPMMMPQHDMMDLQGYPPSHGGQMMGPGSRDKVSLQQEPCVFSLGAGVLIGPGTGDVFAPLRSPQTAPRSAGILEVASQV